MLARVAELADAQDLKSCCGDTVPVRFRSRALKKETVVYRPLKVRPKNLTIGGRYFYV